MSQETFTTNEAAEELGVTPARVRQMVLNGLLAADKRGRDLFITRDALEAARHRKTARGPAPRQKPEQATKTTKRPRTRKGARPSS